MILVIGGIASGKRAYVQSLGYEDDKVGYTFGSAEPVLYGLETCLKAGDLTTDELEALTSKDVVVCCEVGQGVVPIDATDRAWQERVGRTCCVLAQCAIKVVRMVCGIPICIKE